MRLIGILNRDGGTFRTIDIPAFVQRSAATFERHGHVFEARIVSGSELLDALERAAADPAADVILAGGGDGTISAAAGVCFRAGKPLAVLPAGTMNFFAQSLRVPPGLDEAVAAIAAGRLFEVDIATANDRPFIYQFSVGIHARLVRIREEMQYRNRWQKMWASIRAVAGAVSKPLKFQVVVSTPQGPQQRVASGVVVSNNLLAEGHLPFADRIADGVLGVYIAKPMSKWDLIKLFVRVLIGRWKAHPRVSEHEVTSVTLTFPRRKRGARAVIDGELIPLAERVELRIHPRQLRVFAPAALAAALAPEPGATQAEGPAPATARDPDAMV
ncbi:MAG TPA: diacylglycerol kinase family lipid kinase [Alphaproteobacteria bacterium]|nr:diacylglycerol kinase family lipid kinase [Alphaproteobacteria bacterium]